MKKKIIYLIVFTILHKYCVFAQNLSNCSIKDSECQKNFYQGMAREHASQGFPDIGIQVLDPFHLTDVDVPVMDVLILTVVDGDCEGIGNCTVLKFETNLDNFERTIEILCDQIVIKGIYKIWSNPFFSQLFGGVLRGYGYGSIVIEDWYFKIVYPFDLVKREDGQIYTEPKFNDGYYVSDVLKDFTVTADNIMLNYEDITARVLHYINKYWWIILKTFGRAFNKISMGYYYDIYEKFFSRVPATQYYSDDLTPYLKINQECGTKE